MNKPIIAIDPGHSTGIAIRTPSGDWSTATLTSKESLWSLFKEYAFEIAIVERFSAQLISGPGLDTTELVGSIEGICYIKEIHFIRHTPQFRYPWLPQAKMMLSNLRQPFTKHENDALAHLLGFEEKGR